MDLPDRSAGGSANLKLQAKIEYWQVRLEVRYVLKANL